MAKINFTKAENALADVLHKRMVEQLLELADSFSENSASSRPVEKDEISIKAKERSIILYALYCDLGRLYRLDRDFYKSLSFKKEPLEELMKNLVGISDDEWQKVLETKTLVDIQLKKISDLQAAQSDEDIINAQQKRSINQRFNVSKRWIPLE